jgi:hypothetical protein
MPRWQTHIPSLRLPLVLAAALAAWLLAASATATPLLLYTFEDAEGEPVNAPSLLAEGLSAGAWTSDLGTLSFVAGNPGSALSTNQWSVDGNPGNALRLVIAPEAGHAFLLTEFGFDQMRSGTGPVAWSLQLDGVSVAEGETSTSFQARAGALADILVEGPVDIALVATGASSSAGTWRIDNFRLEGRAAVVPEPSSAALLATGLAFLGVASRRARAV